MKAYGIRKFSTYHYENHYDHVKTLVCGDVKDDRLEFELQRANSFS